MLVGTPRTDESSLPPSHPTRAKVIRKRYKQEKIDCFSEINCTLTLCRLAFEIKNRRARYSTMHLRSTNPSRRRGEERLPTVKNRILQVLCFLPRDNMSQVWVYMLTCMFVKENIFEIKTLNALLKSSFLIGLGASNFKIEENHSTVIFRVIENIVLLKTYNDMENHLKEIPEDINNTQRYEYSNLVISKKGSIKEKINMDINQIKPDWLRNNFKNLAKLF